jgi:hypothetical protein
MRVLQPPSIMETRRAPQAHAGLTTVAWVADEELAYDEWLRQGSRLGVAGRNAAWWIGDWVNYGTARYGSKYSLAARVTGYDRQTLMNMVYVASRFEISRRRENLSWSHHAELAAFEVDMQERWLDRARADRLSVRDLREALMSLKHSASSRIEAGAGDVETDANTLERASVGSRSRALELRSLSATSDSTVVCPNCGEPFTLLTSE